MTMDGRPACVGIGIAASTGGPNALLNLFSALRPPLPAAVFMVQHGPDWMMGMLASRLARESGLPVVVAEDGSAAAPGRVHLAPGDRHLEVVPGTLALRITGAPKENFVRPAADPLLRSIASSFGRFGIAVVLSGMGRDGALGARAVADAGGRVFVQAPETAVAPSMPRHVLESGIAARALPARDLAEALIETARELDAVLRLVRAGAS